MQNFPATFPAKAEKIVSLSSPTNILCWSNQHIMLVGLDRETIFSALAGKVAGKFGMKLSVGSLMV